MRQIVLDTETTGLDPAQGHRIIEIGALEIVNRQLTGRSFHVYLNPDREIDEGAIAVHGLTNEFLADKPRFPDVVDDLIAFVENGELLIHNAAFDMGFLNAELRLLGQPAMESKCAGVQDTWKMAKELHPGQKNNLDALCRRYEVDNSGRAYHGALLDAQLLAEVYLAMTRGQESLGIDTGGRGTDSERKLKAGTPLKLLTPSAEELAEHAAYLAALSKESGAPLSW